MTTIEDIVGLVSRRAAQAEADRLENVRKLTVAGFSHEDMCELQHAMNTLELLPALQRNLDHLAGVHGVVPAARLNLAVCEFAEKAHGRLWEAQERSGVALTSGHDAQAIRDNVIAARRNLIGLENVHRERADG
jgi:hypothetical protein